jgi:hypothetical protein
LTRKQQGAKRCRAAGASAFVIAPTRILAKPYDRAAIPYAGLLAGEGTNNGPGMTISSELAPAVELANEIPKVIHQTFSSYEALPPAVKANIDRLRRENPGWTYRFYDDEAARNFILDQYGEAFVRYYDSIGSDYGAARADLFRYLALYKVGGVYLDVKSSFTRPIDDVIGAHDAFVLSHWKNDAESGRVGWGQHAELAHIPGGEYQQWHIIAAAGHPFLRAVIVRVLDGIDRYSMSRTGFGQSGVLRLTGPVAYTLAIHPLVESHPCRIVENESVLGLEYSVMAGKSHQALARRHYVSNTSPIVRRAGLAGWLDRRLGQGHALARMLKTRLRALRGS